MNIFVVLAEHEKGSILLGADMDKETAKKQLEYHKSISVNQDWNYRLGEIELTNKRLQFNPYKEERE